MKNLDKEKNRYLRRRNALDNNDTNRNKKLDSAQNKQNIMQYHKGRNGEDFSVWAIENVFKYKRKTR